MRNIDYLWQCPSCAGKLISSDSECWHCQQCSQTYPLIHSIPDFRPASIKTASERWNETNRVKTLLSHFENHSFEELVGMHATMVHERPGILGKLDRQLRLSANQRGEEKMNRLRSCLTPCDTRELINGCILEVGCGVGDMTPFLARQAKTVIAIDVAMDLLVLANKLIVTHGVKNVFLACVGAETLPFVSDCFDLVYASHVIEHLPDQKGSLGEFYRVLRPSGRLYFDSPNRFSISYEPHVQLLGLGYLPRFLMDPYVRLMRGIPYTDKYLLSFTELRGLMRQQPWQVDIHSQETINDLDSRTLKSRIYRKLKPFIPRWLRKYVIAESFLVLARKR